MVDHIFAEQGDDVAAVVIEPMPANNGLLVQRESYPAASAPATSWSLLIFDEVITGFRFAEGGITGHGGVTPDLVPLARSLEVDYRWAPTVGLSTSCNSWRRSGRSIRREHCPVTLAMAAGVPLDLLNDDAHARLEALGALLEEPSPVLARHGHPMRLVTPTVCSVLTWPRAPPRRSDYRARPASCMPTSPNPAQGLHAGPSAYEVGQPNRHGATSKVRGA